MVLATGLSESERAERIADLRRRISGMPGGDDPGAPAPAAPEVGGGRGVSRHASVPGLHAERGPALPESLASLLPGGVLPAGRVVGVAGGAGLRVGLLAAATASGARCAVVGYPALGLAAIHEQGGDLDRLALVPQPGSDAAAVVSVLLDGFEVVVVDPAVCVVSPSRGRVLAGRARTSGAVLLVGPAWPGADVLLQSRACVYGGIGAGHGRLESQVRSVRGSGKSGLPRSVEWVVGRRACGAPAAVTGAGSPPGVVERAG